MAEAVGSKSSTAIAFSDEQAMLLDAATQFARDRATASVVRSQLEGERGFDDARWREMVGLGWTGIAVDETWGGSGLGIGALVPVLETLGRPLLHSPLLATTLAARVIGRMGSDAQRETWLPRICDGDIVSLATIERDGDWRVHAPGATARPDGDSLALAGAKSFVAEAGCAAALLVSVNIDDVPSFVLLERQEFLERLRPMVVIDETRRCHRLDLEGLVVPASRRLSAAVDAAAARSAFDDLHMAGALLHAAEMSGGIAGTLDLIVDYLKTRKQFGRPIGAYQGLKHPTVQVLLGLEAVRSFVYHAATVFDAGGAARELAVRMAKSEAAETFMFAADRAIQFHGGFGFTHECDAQLYLRRAIFSANQYGDAIHHRRRLAELML